MIIDIRGDTLKNINHANEYDSNYIVSFCMRIAALLVGFLLLIVVSGVFPIRVNTGLTEKEAILRSFIAMGICIIICLAPTLIVNILKYKNNSIKYYLMFFSVLIIGIGHTFFGDYVIILYTFPVLLSIIYFNLKISIVAVSFSIFSMLISTILNIYYSIVLISDLSIPYQLEYRFLLHLSFYLLLSGISLLISTKTSSLLRLSTKEKGISDQQNFALDTIISNSKNIFSARNLTEFHIAVKDSIRETTQTFRETDSQISFKIGYLGNSNYYISKGDNKYSKIEVANDFLKIPITDDVITIYTNRTDKATRFTLYDNCLLISFFNENKLIHFILVEMKLDIESPVLSDILEILVSNIGVALRNLRLTLDMLSTQAEMVFAFSQVTEMKSHQTGNHIKRVSEFMKILALGVGYSEDYAEKISIAAMLHDIGKVFIPDEILEKSSKLTTSEYNLIKTHTSKGIELISDIPGDVMQIAKILIREHHERWNGSGYLGLKGDRINILGRLIAVADVFDALVSKRSYKSEWEPRDAYQKITDGSGTDFDPRVVEIFKKNFKKLIEIIDMYKDE